MAMQLLMSMKQQLTVCPAGSLGEGLVSATTSGISIVHRHDSNSSLPESGRSATQQKEGNTSYSSCPKILCSLSSVAEQYWVPTWHVSSTQHWQSKNNKKWKWIHLMLAPFMWVHVKTVLLVSRNQTHVRYLAISSSPKSCSYCTYALICTSALGASHFRFRSFEKEIRRMQGSPPANVNDDGGEWVEKKMASWDNNYCYIILNSFCFVALPLI